MMPYTDEIALLKVFSHGELIFCWSSPLIGEIKHFRKHCNTKMTKQNQSHFDNLTSSPPGRLTDDNKRTESSLELVSTFQRFCWTYILPQMEDQQFLRKKRKTITQMLFLLQKKENRWSTLRKLSWFIRSNQIKFIQVNILSSLSCHVKQT